MSERGVFKSWKSLLGWFGISGVITVACCRDFLDCGCFEKDSEFRLVSDGQTLTLWKLFYTMPDRITKFSIDKGPKSLTEEPNKLNFLYRGAKAKREAPRISWKIWSSLTQSLYFFEAGVSPPHFDVPYDLIKWSLDKGFEKLESGIDRESNLSTSVDGEALVVFNSKSNSKNVTVISLASDERVVYTAPANAEKVEMIDHNSFLVVLHREDDYAEVVHWNPALTSTTRSVEVKFERPTTQLIDVAVVGKRLYGLKRTLENKVEPVELNRACSRVISIPTRVDSAIVN